ncbi:MAG: hypothetical protein JSV27_01860 [Candidatus Bathyarchaeota archaeon]|nr:MAG: hypothetical protein JSV27_01860 [Candidatus Bathyarchaeota archaeon]
MEETESPYSVWSEEDYRKLLANLFDMEENVERGSSRLRSRINDILGRIVIKRIGYYLEKPEDSE